MSPVLTTPLLELTPLAPSAAEALGDDRLRAAAELGLELDPDWPQPPLLSILPRHVGIDVEQAVWGIWVILDPEKRLVVGDIGFHGPPSEDGLVEVGFSIVPGYRRRGYASEAVRALLGWAKDQPSVTTVIARCEPDNQASIGTLRRAGMREDGRAGAMMRWRWP